MLREPDYWEDAKAALRAAVESIEPTDSPSRLKEAFRLAQAQRPQRFVEDEGLDTGGGSGA